jgi:uncharacterized protein YegL
MSSFTRRLPIYLLLDCSESMAGDAITEVNHGVQAMLDALRSDPQALESACLSVITFAGRARQVMPLTEILAFQAPRLSVRTGTAMGAALKLVKQCIQREVVKTTPTTKGDYKPLVILFTDGEPTDEWESIADDLKRQRNPSIANIYAIACGPDADTDVLRRVTDIVLRMKDMSPQAWRKVFVWLTASVQTTSQALEMGREGQPVNLPPLPADVLEVAPVSTGFKDPRPRQLFLHAWCSRNRKPYLMRFARRPDGDRYAALCAHPLESLEEEGGGGASLPPINTAMLDGCPACPYCENPAAVMCACGALTCCSGAPEGNFTCPKCHQSGSLGPGGHGFDVTRSQG